MSNTLIQSHCFASRFLHREMEFLSCGEQGQPVLAFPTQNGHARQWVDFGMIEVLAPFIEEGRIQLFLADAIDEETISGGGSPNDRAVRLRHYTEYIADELIPVILRQSAKHSGSESRMIVTGCSGGAFHAANLFFRSPHLFRSLIALSGVYSTRLFWGSYMDDELYFHSPLDFLPNLSDSHYLDHYRSARIIACCGQGAWEQEMVRETMELRSILAAKGIPAWTDLWGYDVNHDWPWWKRQLPYFLDHALNDIRGLPTDRGTQAPGPG